MPKSEPPTESQLVWFQRIRDAATDINATPVTWEVLIAHLRPHVDPQILRFVELMSPRTATVLVDLAESAISHRL